MRMFFVLANKHVPGYGKRMHQNLTCLRRTLAYPIAAVGTEWVCESPPTSRIVHYCHYPLGMSYSEKAARAMWEGFGHWWPSEVSEQAMTCENYSYYATSQWVLTCGNIRFVVQQSKKKAKEENQRSDLR